MTAIRSDFLWSNASNATIKAWGGAISTNLAAIGLVKTADTGQIDWTTTAVTASASNQTFGYEIWRFNDSLQATKPVYIKIVYGTSPNGAPYPSINVSVGTGSNGAGTLTGLTSTIRGGINDVTPSNLSLPSGATSAMPHYFFGDGSSFWFAMCPLNSGAPGNGGCVYVWSVERTRDASGNATSDGVVYAQALSDRNGGIYYSRCNYISFVTTTVYGTNFYWPISYTGNGYAQSVDASTFYTYPFIIAMPKPEPPSLNILGYQSGIGWYQTVQLVVSGSTHTYMAFPGVVATPPGRSNTENNGGDNSWVGILLRYE